MSGHSAAEMAHEERRYLQVFAWLAILTAAEIGITYAPIARVAVVLLLVILAATKAAMVALFYMHLINEKRTLTWIALTPAILCVFLLFMLFPDLLHSTRGRVHLVPAAPAEEAHH